MRAPAYWALWDLLSLVAAADADGGFIVSVTLARCPMTAAVDDSSFVLFTRRAARQ